jgi:AcrR family transcriptional regulator
MPRQSKREIGAAIEDAAISLFDGKSYKEITMAEVAKQARVSKRTLYKYFPSKMAVFASIFEHYLKQFVEDDRAYDGLGYAETVETMLRQLYEFTNTQKGFMRLFWMFNNEAVEDDIPPELLTHINHWNTKIVERAAGILRQKNPGGFFQKYPPELAVHMFSAINKGIYLQITKETGLNIRGVDRENLINLFCDMILHCSGTPIQS